MKTKNLFALFSLTIFTIIASLALTSAAYHYAGYGSPYNYDSQYGDYWESASYYKSNTYGSDTSPTYTRTTSYDKDVDYIYLGYGDYEKTISYTKTTKVLHNDPYYQRRFSPAYSYQRYTRPKYYYSDPYTSTPQYHYAKTYPRDYGYSYLGYTYPSYPHSRYHKY